MLLLGTVRGFNLGMGMMRIMFQASHKKTALRSRKKMKKIPMSESKLKEMKQYKTQRELQQEQEIRERLQHRSDINRHAKQVAQQLFFPDIKYSSSHVMSKSYSFQHDSKYTGDLQRQLRNTLNSQLLDTYSDSRLQFSPQHYYTLFNQFYYNCLHFQAIKKKFMEKWRMYQDTMKRKGSTDVTPFPYKFIDHKDLVSHPAWKEIVEDLNLKIAEMDSSNIITYIEVCNFMRDTLGYIPQSIFENVVIQGLGLMRKRKLSVRMRLELLRLGLSKHCVKLEKRVVLQQGIHAQTKFMQMIDYALLDLSRVKVLSTDALETIINIVRLYPTIIKPKRILKKIFKNLLTRLSEISFKIVLETLKLYMSYNLLSPQYIQIFQFDLYRKIPTSELGDVIELIGLVEKGRVKGTEVEGMSLLGVGNGRIIEYLKEHQLTSEQLIKLLKVNYSNGYRNEALINLISSEIVRNSASIPLESYLDVFCLLTVQGVRSEFLRDSALERVQKEFKVLREQYKESVPKLLPSLGNPTTQPIKERQLTPSEIYLNQQMIKFLWAYLQQAKDHKINVNLILQNFPSLTFTATHPILIEMVDSINEALKQYALFPKLKKGEVSKQRYENIDYLAQRYKAGIEQLLQLQSDIHLSHMQKQGLTPQVLIRQPWSTKGITIDQYSTWLSQSKDEDLFFNTPFPDTPLHEKLTILKTKHRRQSQPGYIVQQAPLPQKQIQYYQLSESESEVD